LNAANEIVVDAFLQGRLEFLKMTDVIERTMEKIAYISDPDLFELKECDKLARSIASDLIY